MKRSLFLSGMMLLMVLISSCDKTESNSVLVNLRCEYLENPVGIDVLQPRLSWQINSEKRGEKQTAYRILVASSFEKLAADQGDLWDSGKIKSNQSVQVVYNGKPLTTRMFCFWKVQIWDSEKKITSWSNKAKWSMGLLNPEAWKAKWISIERDNKDIDSHDSPMLRKEIALSKQVKLAQISICGLGYYEMFLNGSKVGDHVLDPTWTSYHKNALYVTYDITNSLKSGKNAIGVQLANGVYNQEFKDAWNSQNAPWRAFPQMLLQLDVTYVDETKDCFVSDESWMASTGPITWDQLRMGVMYDARREHPGWNTIDFDDSGWEPAIVREGITGKLSAQMSEPIKVMQTLKPVSVVKKGKDYEVDFGQNIAGWTRLKVSGKAGDEITLDHVAHGLGLVFGKPLQTEVYTLNGKGQEVWEPGFTYHGFSKVRVSGFPGVPVKENFDARVAHTAFEDRGMFECSNPLLNKIVDMSRWSYIGNFVGIPTDCPHREKLGWSGDAQIAAELGLTYYGSEAAYTRWMLDFEAVQASDGKLPCIVPDGGGDWGTRFLDGPAWESAYLNIPWHIYEYRGDQRILEHHYENYKRWFSWYSDESKVIKKDRFKGGDIPGTRYKNPQQVNQDNIICYGIGDWPPNGQTPFEITSTTYYYNAAKVISKIAHIMGKHEDEKEYADIAAKVKIAFNREFYDEETGTYSNGSHTGMSCALYFGLVAEKNRQRVADNLADSLEKNGYNIKIGCLGSKFLLRALTENGHMDVAYNIITKESSPGWGYLAATGRTTFSETLSGKGSNNHVFLGDISAWMMQYLAGIGYDAENPGFQRFIIKPTFIDDLGWVKAHHDSPYGRIESNWKREGLNILLEVTVPPNSSADVYFPVHLKKKVKESGNPAGIAEGVKFLRIENGHALFNVGSGKYKFEFTIN